MTITQNVATILKQHVTLEVEGIDRLYLYVPRLQIVEGALGFIRRHRGHPVASTRMVEPITRRLVAVIEKFVRDRALPLIGFDKGQRKDEVAARFRASFTQPEGWSSSARRRRSVRFIGRSAAGIRAPARPGS